jgi:rhodanese-related sulfurtransferase
MSAKVYLQAGVIAAVGVAIAVVDSTRRPVKTPEPMASPRSAGDQRNGGAKGAGPEAAPEAKPDPVAGVEPEVNAEVTPQPAPPEKADGVSVKVPVADPSKLPVKIGVGEALSMLEDHQAVFIDGRKPDVFAAGHIPGAFHMQFVDITDGNAPWQEFFRTMNRDDWFVVYCDGGDCHESEHIRKALTNYGFANVLILEVGFPGWKSAGLPVESR